MMVGEINVNWYDKFLKLASFRNKLSLLSNKISNMIFQDIVDNKIEARQITIDQVKEPLLKNYDINKVVIDINPYGEIVLVNGNWIREWKTVLMKAQFNGKNKSHYQDVSVELNRVIRHEMEHGFQTKLNPSIVPSWDSNLPNDVMGRVNKNKDYLLNESEINAFIREFMPRAKKAGVSIESILFDFIYKKLFEFDREVIDNQVKNKTKFGKELIKILNGVTNKYKNVIEQLYSNRENYINRGKK
jgi:hypothetical protein